MANATNMEDVSTIGCSSFYGRKNKGATYVVLPPENTYVSDVGSSSSDEEWDDSNLNTNIEPLSLPHIPTDILHISNSDGEWSTDDEEPLANFVRASKITNRKVDNKKKKQTTQTNFQWFKEEFQHVQIPNDYSEYECPSRTLTALQYFQKFFDDSIFDYISEQTNIYSTLTNGSSVNTSPFEIKTFIGIELLMGVVRMPSFEDYWSILSRYSVIADVMPVKRFKTLRRMIHFQDNMADANGDRLFKIRPLLEKIRRNCNKIEGESRYSIDEMMILYKGTKAGNLRQYMPKKPKKWGFKMFVRAGVSGIVYDFFIYTGSSTFDNMTFSGKESDLGSGGKVVIQLCRTIPNPQNTIVYFDNWFTSIELICFLKNEFGINSLGTIRSNRLRGCTLEQDKALLKKGRGTYDYKVDNKKGIAVVKWADTKCVTLASSYVSYSPVIQVKRYSKEERKKVDVGCPQIIKQYNAHMGGVDLADMLIALYKTPYKSRRWYLGIFSQLIDISVNNAWLLYRRDMDSQGQRKHDNLKTFRIHLATSLIKTNNASKSRKSDFTDEHPAKKIRVPVGPRPTEDVRFDQVGHFPIFGEKGRCKYCTSGQTTIFCQKCELRLCIVTGNTARNCFTIFHQKGT